MMHLLHLALAIALLFVPAGSWAQQPMNIKIAHGFQQGSLVNTYARVWSDAIRTERLRPQIFPEGQLGDSVALVQSLRLGTLDVGFIPTSQVPGFRWAVTPFLFSDFREATQYINEKIAKDPGSADLKIGAFLPYETYSVLSGEILNEPPSSSFLFITGSSTTEFQRRVLNRGYPRNIENALSNRIERATSGARFSEIPLMSIPAEREWRGAVTLTQHSTAGVLIVMSRRFLNALPPDQHRLLMLSTEKVAQQALGLVEKEIEEKIRILGRRGITVRPPSNPGAWMMLVDHNAPGQCEVREHNCEINGRCVACTDECSQNECTPRR